MNIKKPEEIKSSEITEEKDYLNRRSFLRGAVLIGSAVASGLVYRAFNSPNSQATGSSSGKQAAGARFMLPNGERATDFQDITNYNNFYEFSTDKQEVAHAAKNFRTRPWSVAVGGLVDRPAVFDLDDLLKIAPLEERIYRHRCVEAWSMVIPWLGFPLAKVLERVRPLGKAKFVQFTTLLDLDQMPNQKTGILYWPYVEGLRLDEAMHPLTILAAGLYGKKLLPQNGAPLRLVVPWKYGFKGCKSIVRIDLTDKVPSTAWNRANPGEYGFYSNVNPDVDHPRWSQAMERRIGEFGLRKTLPFNGYADQVAHLYKGMDLKVYF